MTVNIISPSPCLHGALAKCAANDKDDDVMNLTTSIKIKIIICRKFDTVLSPRQHKQDRTLYTMLNNLLRKPKPICFVIKRPHTQTMYSIPNNDGPGNDGRTVVAFRYKQQAATLRRLMMEIENDNSFSYGSNGAKYHKKTQKLTIEKYEIDFLQHVCKSTSLNLLVFDGDSSASHMYEACGDKDVEYLRDELETKYRFGYL